MRTIIELPDEQIEKLARICQKTRTSRASVIRQAIEEYLQHHLQEEEDEAFGLWKKRAKDSLAYQDELRGEWEK